MARESREAELGGQAAPESSATWAPAAAAAPPPGAPAFRTLLAFSFRQLARSRRTLPVALLVFLPVLLGGVALYVQRRGGLLPGDPLDLFPLLAVLLHAQFLVQLVTLLYGTSLFADEVEGQTLVCLFTRPVRREALLLAKLAALLLFSLLLLLSSVLATWAVLAVAGTVGGGSASLLLRDAVALGLAACAYGSLFLLLGLAVRRPVLLGLVFCFGWEGLLSSLPGYTKHLTFLYYIRSLLPHKVVSGDAMFFLADPCPPGRAVLVLLGVSAALVGLSLFLVRRRDWPGAHLEEARE